MLLPDAIMRRLSPRARRWLIFSAAVLLAGWLLAVLLPLLPSSSPPGERAITPEQAAALFTVIETRDVSVPGWRRQIAVVEMARSQERFLSGKPVLETAVARAAARFVAGREKLDAVEIRLRRPGGGPLIRLRHSPSGAGGDGSGTWSWQTLP